jgi:hypothetical protein
VAVPLEVCPKIPPAFTPTAPVLEQLVAVPNALDPKIPPPARPTAPLLEQRMAFPLELIPKIPPQTSPIGPLLVQFVAVPPILGAKNHPGPSPTFKLLPEESITRLLTATSQGNRPRQFGVPTAVMVKPLPLNTMFVPDVSLQLNPVIKFKLRVRLYVVFFTSTPLNVASTLTAISIKAFHFKRA